jgi:arginyl-tRNA synthetase
MSKRAGNFILMSDIIDEIGDNALKFIFLTKKSDTHLEFDLTDLKKKDSSNPVFYINYAYSRVNSMVEKSKYSVKEIEETDIKNISKNLQDILFHSMILQSILEDAFTTRQLQKVTEYLKQLASMIHSFYTENKILDNQNEKEILKTLLITANSIKIGLTLLGISIQEKM